jgi:hypothetical protein
LELEVIWEGFFGEGLDEVDEVFDGLGLGSEGGYGGVVGGGLLGFWVIEEGVKVDGVEVEEAVEFGLDLFEVVWGVGVGDHFYFFLLEIYFNDTLFSAVFC